MNNKPCEWKVYFDGGFYDRRGTGRAGTEVKVKKDFSWNGHEWYIPAVYVCGKGLVMDVCIKVEPEVISAYYEKWGLAEGRLETLSKEEQRLAWQENPLDVEFQLKLQINSRLQENWSGSGANWVPERCLFGEMENTEEAMEFVEHYDLDKTKGWAFHRVSIPWGTKTKPMLRTLLLQLEPRRVPVPGPRFITPKVGESISFLHPIKGTTHNLTVHEFQRARFPSERLSEEEYEFPENYYQMIYTIQPDIPTKEYTVKDVCDNDTPKRKESSPYSGAASIGIIGGGCGPTAVFIAEKGTTEMARVTCSAFRFEPAETVEWEMIFHRKPCENLQVELLKGKG